MLYCGNLLVAAAAYNPAQGNQDTFCSWREEGGYCGYH